MDCTHAASLAKASTPFCTQEVGPAADVYGVGMLLLELLTAPGAVEAVLAQSDMQAALLLVRHCSPEVQSLLASMLETSPSLRITAAAALTHAWFADALGVCDVIEA